MRFVLVHGAWHGAWCWDKVVPLLEADGHSVTAVDLPGHGENPSAVAGMTLESYGREVANAVESAGEDVVLVGHSMGGMAISEAAELVSERLAALVYVCAFLPGPGNSLGQLADNDPDALVIPNLVVDEAGALCEVRADVRAAAFYGECSDEDAAAACARLGPEALAAFGAPAEITEERAGSVRRIYIECVRDRAISVTKQREMYAARPCERVISIDTDHSPFLSRPDELAAHLAQI